MWNRWILMILRILRILWVVLIAFARFTRDTLEDPEELRLHLRNFRGDLSRTLTVSQFKRFSSTSSDDAQRSPSKTSGLREGVADDAQLRREWLRRKQEDKVENEHLDKLMMMVGLENAKAYFLDIHAAAHPARGQYEDLRNVVLDTVIMGNPGTGKKTVARLYADLLMSLGLVPRAKPLRISGPQLRSKKRWQSNLKEIQEMRSNDGGIVLLEGAQSIPDVRSVLGKLLAESAKGPSKIAIIVSSQGKETIDFTPVLNVNLQIPHIKLPDYTDEELRKILVDMIHRKFGEPIKDIEGGFDGPYLHTFVSIIGRGRGAPNFGNVKTLQSCFSTLCDRRAKRLQREAQNPDLEGLDDFLFTKADMLGEKATEMGSRSAAWKTLQSMIGLEKVKASVEAMFSLAVVNYYRKLQGKKPIRITLNRCFLGPPGTGKTTVAKLYAQILVDLGLISKSTVVMKAASDLIGPYIGHSEMRTKNALDEARSGVLVIDDAHMLLPGATYDTGHRTDIFRAAIIDTLVANIQPEPGEDRAVILIGYTDGMLELFETSNPGLARRFPQEEAFHFTAFNDDQLGQILELKLRRYELDAAPEAIKVAREMLSTARHRPNFGNGGDVENLIGQAKARYQARVSSMGVSEGVGQLLGPSDFDPDFARAMEASERCIKLFSDMQGVEEIKSQFRGYQDIAANLKLRGQDPRPYIPLALVFKGPPGTGKTTVARKAAQIFYDMGILAAPELIECSVSDLVSEHAGLTGRKVIRMFERALGKVLFIDEAYRLGEMRAVDAIGEIVDCMTKERFARKIVIILAGYEDDINKLMQLNRGLRSRFATDVIFRPMRPAASLALLGTFVGKLGIQLEGLTQAKSRGPILHILAQLVATKSWANGRGVEAFSQNVIEYALKHRAPGTDPESRVIIRAYELLPLLESRLARAKQEDAEMAGSYIPNKSTNCDLLHDNARNSTRCDDKHEGINIDVPGTTASTSDMVLLDPGRSRDSRREMTRAQTDLIDDINSVAEVANEAVEATLQDYLDRSGRLSNLGNRLSVPSERTGSIDDLTMTDAQPWTREWIHPPLGVALKKYLDSICLDAHRLGVKFRVMQRNSGKLWQWSLCCLLLMEEEFRSSFRQTLSKIQEASFVHLLDWWTGRYQDIRLSAAAVAYIVLESTVKLPTDKSFRRVFAKLSKSSYHYHLFHLFCLEFSVDTKPEPCAIFPSSLMRARDSAAVHSCTQRIGCLYYDAVLRDRKREAKPQGESTMLTINEFAASIATALDDLLAKGSVKIDNIGNRFKIPLHVATLWPYKLAKEPELILQGPYRSLGAVSEPCWWLTKAEKEGYPYYLWDIANEQTVETSTLMSPSYTAISHTWGRWIIKGKFADVEGVKWRVPCNSIFNVKHLPRILKDVPRDGNYVWFDLLCIPQDRQDPISHQEIARQAKIFSTATRAVIWFSNVNHMNDLKSIARWLALSLLEHPPGGWQSDFNPLDEETREVEKASSTVLAKGEVSGGPMLIGRDTTYEQCHEWLSSTWTFQEACLRPDMWLCTRDWTPLRLVDGDIDSVLELSGLMAILQQNSLRRADPDGTASGLNEIESEIRCTKVPRSILLLTCVMMMSGMAYIFQPTVGDILSQGSNRFCQDDRSEAIMSVLGVHDWDDRKNPTVGDAVLGKYSVAFLKEVRKKWGSSLFSTFAPTKEAMPNLRNSMLPFKAGYKPYFQGPQVLVTPHDLIDHDSVRSWEISQNGHVVIRKAALIAASDKDGPPIDADVFDMSAILDMYGRRPEDIDSQMDLQKWVEKGKPRKSYAVCTSYSHEYGDFTGNVSWVCRGLLFREVSDVPENDDASGRPGPRTEYLEKCGLFFVSRAGVIQKSDLAPSTNVDWIVV